MKATEIIRMPKATFEKSLDDCLTIINYPSKNQKYYVCIYTTEATFRKAIKVVVY